MESRKIYSVLGDSLSTFEGYTPGGYEFYDSYTIREAGMKSVEDTWWMKVIRAMEGKTGYNNSIAGSTVSGGVAISGTAKVRHESLAINGTPDVILIYMGSNDWAYSVLPEEFEESYQHMIVSLLKMYPETEICCATILRGQDAPDPEMRFFNIDGCISTRIYSDIIRKCAKKCGVKLADLEKYQVEYGTIDGVHPTAEGMETIAELWIRELNVFSKNNTDK